MLNPTESYLADAHTLLKYLLAVGLSHEDAAFLTEQLYIEYQLTFGAKFYE